MKMFHNPEVQQINFLDERFYTVDNEVFYPSVTTVLDVYPKGFGFNEWLKANGFNADIILERAGTQGSNVHSAVDTYLSGKEITWADSEGNAKYTFDEWMMVLRFVEFWERYSPILVANEFAIISEKFRLGGTADLFCEVKGQRWLIDIKTSNHMHDSYALQLAAYATMFNDLNPNMKVDRVGILWLKANTRGEDKKGLKMQGKGWQIVEWDRPYEESWKIFEHVRKIWDEQNPNYRPKNVSYPDRVKIKSHAIAG